MNIWNLRLQKIKNLNIEKIAFKVVQIKFLAMHITSQKLSFNIFTVGNVLNFNNFNPYNVLLAIATNILVLLKTGFVVQGQIQNYLQILMRSGY